MVQALCSPGFDALVRGLVRVRAPAFRVVDDADRSVAIRYDVHEAANGLRARRDVRGKQSAGGMREAEMDEDRGAFGQHRTVRKLECRDLTQRIDAAEFVETWPR